MAEKLIIVLFALALLVHAAPEASHSCKTLHKQVPGLFSCSTRDQFCSSYIGASNLFTKTAHATVPGPLTTATITNSITPTVTKYSATITQSPKKGATTYVVTTLTQTITSLACPTATTSAAPLEKKAVQPPCDINKQQQAPLLSSLCSCLIAPITTVTSASHPTSSVTVNVTALTRTTITTALTVTLAATTTTVSSTATVTACTTQGANFLLQVNAPKTPYNNLYVTINKTFHNQNPTTFTPDAAEALPFVIDTRDDLLNARNGDLAAQLYNGGSDVYYTVYFPDPGVKNPEGLPFVLVDCHINPTDVQLQCNSIVGSVFYGCSGKGTNRGWAIAAVGMTVSNGLLSCMPISFNVIPTNTTTPG